MHNQPNNIQPQFIIKNMYGKNFQVLYEMKFTFRNVARGEFPLKEDEKFRKAAGKKDRRPIWKKRERQKL